MIIRFLSLFCIFFTVIVLHAQEQYATDFESQFEQAKKYSRANLSGESIEALNKALTLAETNEEFCEVLAFKGELLRSTQKFEQALQTLWSMKTYISGNRTMEIKMLGRLAAVHQEHGMYTPEIRTDSVRYYIDQALSLAELAPKLHEIEIASLYNELGMFVYRRGDTPTAREMFEKSSAIFEKRGEIQMLVTPLSNLLELESCTHNHGVSNELAKKLDSIIKDKEWHAQSAVAHNALRINASTQDDTLSELFYKGKYIESNLQLVLKNNSDKMLALSEIYERDKLKQKIALERSDKEKKTKELEEAKISRDRLIIILILSGLFAGGIVFLFIRERRIKEKINAFNEELNHANERYHLLVVESNHRIKNNLQMITAMLEYTSKGISPSNQRILQSISGKINAISALHKHLYIDVHNEFIPVNAYFKELVKLYEGISPEGFNVVLQTEDVHIRSERIVYFGLIFNEMLSNTLEHSPNTIGKIEMFIDKAQEGYIFTYRDFSKQSTSDKEGTGTELIRNLIIRIGGKNFTLDPSTGTYQFYFTTDFSGTTAP